MFSRREVKTVVVVQFIVSNLAFTLQDINQVKVIFGL